MRLKTEKDRKKSKCSRIGNPVFPNFFFLYNDYLFITLRDREAVIFGIEKIFSRLKIGLFSSSYFSDGLSPSVYSNFHKENGFFWIKRGMWYKKGTKINRFFEYLVMILI